MIRKMRSEDKKTYMEMAREFYGTKTKKNSIDCIGTVDSTNGHAGSSTGI